MNKPIPRILALADRLTAVLAVFTCTFFFYRDFGSRMLYGYAILGLVLMLHLLRRLRRDEPPAASPVSTLLRILRQHILHQKQRIGGDILPVLLDVLHTLMYCLIQQLLGGTPCKRRITHQQQEQCNSQRIHIRLFRIAVLLHINPMRRHY